MSRCVQCERPLRDGMISVRESHPQWEDNETTVLCSHQCLVKWAGAVYKELTDDAPSWITHGDQLVPFDPEAGKEGLANAVQAVLRRRGPTTQAALECWASQRSEVYASLVTLLLFELGEVDFSWTDDHSDILISRVEK